LIQSGYTWVAACRGRTFVCSQINEAGDDDGLFEGLFASEQVSCREALESPDGERARAMRGAPGPETAAPP